LEPLIAEFGVQKAQALQADLTIESDVARLFLQASTSFGPVQSIIVNHGVWPTADQPVVKMSLDQWKSTMDTNLTSSFLVSREYLRNLEFASDALKAYASIIFIGSTAGKYGKSRLLRLFCLEEGSHDKQVRRATPIMRLQRAVVFQQDRNSYGDLMRIAFYSNDVRFDSVAQERNCENCAGWQGKLHWAWMGEDSMFC
jgi:NAD(P)-dependent dehydrogenase (short-subunit alcohol dehydrogenase family)